MTSHSLSTEDTPINRFSFERARAATTRTFYPIRWLVALTAGVLVVLVFVLALSFFRTGEFGISSDLGSSSTQSDLDEFVLDATNAFTLDEAAVLETAGPALDGIAEVILARSELEIAVVGHARVEGNEEFDNVRLSERRALLVIDELVDRGVRFERLIPVAMGSSEARSTVWSGEELAADQRVEFIIVVPG